MAKVLLIEPDREVRDMYTAIIENAGFDVVESVDAAEGKEKLLKGHFAAIIINSPKTEVLWFLGVVRSNHSIAVSTVPIMVVLEDSHDNTVEYVEAGASKCISQFPSSGERLIEKLRSILNLPKLAPNL